MWPTPGYAQEPISRRPELQQKIRYEVKVELVSVFATVQDPDGNLVTDLEQNDFIIYDNGVPQTISQFSKEYHPLSVLILLDTSGSMAGEKLKNARKSLTQFVKRLNRGDEALLMAFHTRPRILHPFTGDLRRIRQSMRDLEGRGSTALYDAILTALDEAQKSLHKRKALLLISDGINTYGKAELDGTIDQLRRQGVELFAIGLETRLPEDFQYRKVTRSVLDRLTHSAGGEAFIVSDSKELGRICDMISERMHNQYAFGYYPPETSEGEWHDIRIEAKASGYRVIASKTGYYSTSDNK
jgi:Ca-activated chloride channel family protein